MVELGSSVGKANELVYGIQKATLFKRFSSWLFDTVIILVLATGFITIASAVVGYDGLVEEMQEIQEGYATKYGIKTNITEEEFNALSDSDKQKYHEAQLEMNKDERLKEVYGKIINYTILSITLSAFFSITLCEFVIPLILKNGQTIGKKIFQLVVVKKNCVKVSPMQMFVRSIFGKYTIEVMVPIYMLFMIMFGNIGIIGAIIGVGVVFINIVLVLSSYDKSAIHDYMAVTVVCDKNSQMIFESDEALIEFKQKLQEEQARKEKYTL